MGAGSGGFYVARQMMKQAEAAVGGRIRPDNMGAIVMLMAFAFIVSALGWGGALVGALLMLVAFLSQVWDRRIGQPRRWYLKLVAIMGGLFAIMGAAIVVHHRLAILGYLATYGLFTLAAKIWLHEIPDPLLDIENPVRLDPLDESVEAVEANERS
jgi:hypothetical protein